MDASMKQILGIVSTERKMPAPLIPKQVESAIRQIRETINAGYKRMGLPEISRSDFPLVMDFHQRAIPIIEEENRAAVEAIKKVDPDLRGEVRTARMVGIARLAVLAMQERLANAATPLVRVINDARAIVDQAMNREPKDPAAAMVWMLKVSDMRRQVQSLNTHDRTQVAIKLAKRGDETFPAVFLDTPTNLIPENLVVQLTAEYQKAVAGDQAALLDEAREALAEVKAIIGCAELAMGAGVNGLGLPPSWKDFPVPDIVKAWPKAAKTAFINAKGQEAYMDLLQGQLGLETALGIFRAGLEG